MISCYNHARNITIAQKFPRKYCINHPLNIDWLITSRKHQWTKEKKRKQSKIMADEGLDTYDGRVENRFPGKKVLMRLHLIRAKADNSKFNTPLRRRWSCTDWWNCLVCAGKAPLERYYWRNVSRRHTLQPIAWVLPGSPRSNEAIIRDYLGD